MKTLRQRVFESLEADRAPISYQELAKIVDSTATKVTSCVYSLGLNYGVEMKKVRVNGKLKIYMETEIKFADLSSDKIAITLIIGKMIESCEKPVNLKGIGAAVLVANPDASVTNGLAVNAISYLRRVKKHVINSIIIDGETHYQYAEVPVRTHRVTTKKPNLNQGSVNIANLIFSGKVSEALECNRLILSVT